MALFTNFEAQFGSHYRVRILYFPKKSKNLSSSVQAFTKINQSKQIIKLDQGSNILIFHIGIHNTAHCPFSEVRSEYGSRSGPEPTQSTHSLCALPGGSVGPGELLQEAAQGRVGQDPGSVPLTWGGSWCCHWYLVALLAPGNCSRR